VLIESHPVLVSLGPWAVRWFGLLALTGLGVAIALSLWDIDRQRLSRKVALDALAWGLPAGLVTAWLVHALGYWDYYLTNLTELWQLNIDRLSLWGGLVGGGAVVMARLRDDPMRRRRVLDAVVPYVALGIAVARLGEFLDGHGQGLSSTLPWATQYTDPMAASPDFGVPRHPVQIYDALVALALFAVLSSLPRALPAGTRLATFLVLYALGRIILAQVRLDPSFLFGLQIEQLLALGCLAFGVVFGLRPMLRSSTVRAASFDAIESQTSHAKKDTLAA
jgi:phosphatidylglycerol:prolipoprotein diacylglycerol transferase